MDFVCIGISHNTAPLEIRERLWFSEEEIRKTLPFLKEHGCAESVLFSTCNRTELYTIAENESVSPDALKNFLMAKKSASGVGGDHFFVHRGSEAIRHLYRVASGVDSMVLGDVQILAQVKDGFALAIEQSTAQFFMNKLFPSAFHVAKRVRTETVIGEGAVSVGYAAVELAERIFNDLKKKTALVIGAGETASLTAKHLRGKDIGRLFIANRTEEHARQLAAIVQGQVIPLDGVQNLLPSADIVISSVGTERYVLTADDIRRLNRHRHPSALFLVDIGVPRNIEPAAKEIENVFLYDLDSLNLMVDENLGKRKNEIPHVESIIAEEVLALEHWSSSLQATPTISALTELLEKIRKDELDQHINRFETRDRELLELLTKRIVNKILHHPIVHLRNGHDDSLPERLHTMSTVRRLFGLNPEPPERKHDE